MRSLVPSLPVAIVFFCLPSVFGCKSGRSDRSASASASSVTSAALPSSPSSVSTAVVELAPTSSAQLPEGPVLAIQAGIGVGPIRIGATVPTIERLMEAPCDVKTPAVCRYIVRAVEFDLDEKGVTRRIVIHRKDRPAGLDANGKPQAYGFFNGGIPPGVGLGMVPKAVHDLLGPPKSSERVNTPNEFHTIARDTYPGGMVLEFDEYKNGRVMLGGVVLTKS